MTTIMKDENKCMKTAMNTKNAVITKTAKKAKPVSKPKTVENSLSAPATINPPADVYSNEMVSEMSRRSRAIRKELCSIEGSFSKIAFNLHWIHENGSYKTLGYKNVYDFAKLEFGIARGTCSNFINVVERFAKRDGGQVVEQIDDCYKDFKSSQLILMLGLSDSEIKKLDCGMSVRDMKKQIKTMTAEESGQSACGSSPSEEEGKEEVIDVDSKEVRRQVLITICDMGEYDSQEDKIYDMIRRALKDPKHRVEIAYTW